MVDRSLPRTHTHAHWEQRNTGQMRHEAPPADSGLSALFIWWPLAKTTSIPLLLVQHSTTICAIPEYTWAPVEHYHWCDFRMYLHTLLITLPFVWLQNMFELLITFLMTLLDWGWLGWIVIVARAACHAASHQCFVINYKKKMFTFCFSLR